MSRRWQPATRRRSISDTSRAFGRSRVATRFHGNYSYSSGIWGNQVGWREKCPDFENNFLCKIKSRFYFNLNRHGHSGPDRNGCGKPHEKNFTNRYFCAIFRLTIAPQLTILTFALNKKEFRARRLCLISRTPGNRKIIL